MASSNQQPLIVIVGPTASGKTAASIELAKKVGGEIICADSRTVYKGMDVGTAKPTKQEQQSIPHHLLDIVDPDQAFTVADFQKLAKEKITDIRLREKVPIIVGGTGLYINSIIFNYTFGVQSSEKLRKKFEKYELNELWEYCYKNNIELPENKHNKRYVIRSIERKNTHNHKQDRLINNCFVVGISTDKKELLERMNERANAMFTDKLLYETQRLFKQYDLAHESMTANIYPLMHEVNTGELSVEEAKRRFVTLDWRLAKRQMTWLRRNQSIIWCSREEVVGVASSYVSARQK